MSTEAIVFGSLWTIFSFALFGILLYLIDKKDKQQHRLLDISQYEINTRTSLDNTIPSALDGFISDCFNDYLVMVLLPKGEEYITEEREQQIIADLSAKVAERISPNFIDKLSQYYNVDTLDKVIADKIYIAVLNYCVNNNTIKPVPKQ